MAAAIIALGCARRRATTMSAPDPRPTPLPAVVHTTPGLRPPVSGTANGCPIRRARASHPIPVRCAERVANIDRDNAERWRVRAPRGTRTFNNITQWGGWR